jgi:hypothetical protein
MLPCFRLSVEYQRTVYSRRDRRGGAETAENDKIKRWPGGLKKRTLSLNKSAMRLGHSRACVKTMGHGY